MTYNICNETIWPRGFVGGENFDSLLSSAVVAGLRFCSGIQAFGYCGERNLLCVYFFFSWAPRCRQVPRITDLWAFQNVLELETEPLLSVKKDDISDQTCSWISLRIEAFKLHKVCLGLVGNIEIVIDTGAWSNHVISPIVDLVIF